jgi:hypothetical protein
MADMRTCMARATLVVTPGHGGYVWLIDCGKICKIGRGDVYVVLSKQLGAFSCIGYPMASTVTEPQDHGFPSVGILERTYVL